MTTLSGTVTNQEPIPGPVGIINPARRVRTNSADAQDSFGDLLADKQRPEVSEQSSETDAESASSNSDERPEQTSSESSGSGESEPRPDGDPSSETTQPETNGESASEPATRPESGTGTNESAEAGTSDAAERPVEATPPSGDAQATRPNEAVPTAPVAEQASTTTRPVQTGDGSGKAEQTGATRATEETPIVRLAREGEQARHRLDGIRHQLRNAASVDLAQVATQELVGRVSSGAVVQADQRAASAPKDAASHPAGQVAPPASEDGPAETPATPLPSSTGEQRVRGDSIASPIRAATPEHAPVEVARPASVASNTGQSTVAEAAASLASSERPGQPDRPTNLIGRADLLVRLAGENGASRGAVTALDRIGGIGPTGRAAPGSTPPAAIGRNANPTAQDAVLSQVRNGLASLLTRGGGKMTVVLRPDHLGEVRIRVETQADGSITARFNASTDLGRDSLTKGLEALRSSLEARGVKVDDLRVDPPAQPTAQSTATTEFSGSNTSMSSDADGRPDQSPTRDNAHSESSETGTASQDETASWDEEPDRGIWTDLGLDAIA